MAIRLLSKIHAVKGVCLALILVMITASLVAGAFPPSIAHADSDTYSWPDASYVDANYDWGYSTCPASDSNCMLLNGLKAGVKYGEADPWVYYLRNCTSYVAQKINQVFGKNINGWGNAYQWDDNAIAANYTNDTAPQVGDIAQWGTEKGGGYGHVAYVYAVNNGIASLDEYNAAGTGEFSSDRTTASTSAGAADHYIHIGSVTATTGTSSQTSSNSGVAVTDSASPTIGFTQVFTQGPNNSLTTRWEVPGDTSWSSSTVGASSGTTYSPASVTVTQSAKTNGTSATDAGFTQVFVQGPNNSLVTYWQTPGISTSWSGPLTIAGAGTTYSAPAAVVNQTTGLTQVFAQGPSHSLIGYWAAVGQSWSSATMAGSNTTYSAPTATVTEAQTAAPAGFTQVFAQGASNSLVTYWETPGVSTWSSGSLAGSGTTYSSPAAVVTQKDTSYTTKGFTHVFAQGASNNLVDYWANPGTTSFSSGTAATSGIYCDATDINCGPTATVTEPTTNNTPGGFTQAFSKGYNNSLNTYWQTPGHTTWSGTTIAGSGTTASNPAGVVTQTTKYTPAGFTHVFTEDTSNGLEDFWETPAPGASWSSGAPGAAGTTYSAP